MHREILASVIFVVGGTALLYVWLSETSGFWNAQRLWSIALIAGYAVVAFEYFRYGWLIHHSRTTANISPFLTLSIFAMQCILFVKGIFFGDWSLVAGTLMVNSGVVFTLYQTAKKMEILR